MRNLGLGENNTFRVNTLKEMLNSKDGLLFDLGGHEDEAHGNHGYNSYN